MADHFENLFASTSRETAWPAVLPAMSAQLASLLLQLEQSQWWRRDTLAQQQTRQLQVLLRHARAHTGAYSEARADAGSSVTPSQSDAWRSLPLVTRAELQQDTDAYRSRSLPKTHGRKHALRTSGSTGQVLEVDGTDLTQFMWMAFTMREHLWHRRDFRQKLAVIRYLTPKQRSGVAANDGQQKDWGAPVNALYRSGPAAVMDINSDVADQWTWLERQQPAYLLTYPSNLRALAQYSLEQDRPLQCLRQVRTISEIVTDELRALCINAFGAPLIDVYSSNEVGNIALQCPDCSQYHVQSENVLCEILNERDEACAPGETGRVVLTALHNFAMPLIRYAIGDYATVGEAGQCARGLPALSRIMGRRRNMLTLANGGKRWPTGLLALAQLAPIDQFQLVQERPGELELRLVTRRPLTGEDEQRIAKSLEETYGEPFRLTFTYLDAIRPNDNGKFEEFVSRLA